MARSNKGIRDMVKDTRGPGILSEVRPPSTSGTLQHQASMASQMSKLNNRSSIGSTSRKFPFL
jgi:hypothetical protein